MKTKTSLQLKTTSVRSLSPQELGDVAGGYTSIAACGTDPTNRPCITVHPATGCPITSAQPCPTTGSAQCPR